MDIKIDVDDYLALCINWVALTIDNPPNVYEDSSPCISRIGMLL